MLIMILLVLSKSVGADEIPADKMNEWSVCSKDSDCVLVNDHCNGPASINKKYLLEYEMWMSGVRSVTLCQNFVPGQWLEGVTAFCDHSKCGSRVVAKNAKKFKK